MRIERVANAGVKAPACDAARPGDDVDAAASAKAGAMGRSARVSAAQSARFAWIFTVKHFQNNDLLLQRAEAHQVQICWREALPLVDA